MMVASAGCATTDDGGTSGSVVETGEATSASMGTEAGDPGDETGGDTDGGTSEIPGDDVTITAFSEEHIYFGAENRRQVDVEVSFPPAEQLFESVRLNFSLGCPNDNCDDWDRYGTLGLVEAAGTEDERFVELQRFVTPFGVGGAWSVDLTMLQPLLAGDVTLRVFIDTWVGPGHAQGDGWLFSADFEFVGGVPSAIPDRVYPVWYQTYSSGHPDNPVSDQVVPQTVQIEGSPKFAALRSFITGHGFGSADNCAEFCPLDHTFTINGTPYTRTVWRENCLSTGVPEQQGTWKYPRAGWCPGTDAYPILEDITADAQASDTLEFGYALQDYVNDCRPDAPVCMGCVGSATCDGGHVLPYYYLSALVVTYRD